MIATIGTILVWLIIGAVGIVGLVCAFIGFMFLLHWPK